MKYRRKYKDNKKFKKINISRCKAGTAKKYQKQKLQWEKIIIL